MNEMEPFPVNVAAAGLCGMAVEWAVVGGGGGRSNVC